jgi:DNA repair exonuclease SbcCD ATPase subunit
MKVRLKDMTAVKEKAVSGQRKIVELEGQVSLLQRCLESGEEVQRRWMDLRKEIVQEGLSVEDEEDIVSEEPFSVWTAGIPPEIATVVRKFQGLKFRVKQLEEEKERLVAVADERSRRCALLDEQVKNKNDSITVLEKEVKTANETINHLQLENRKIAAQQVIWKRESEGMRSLLDTYEMQETNAAKTKQASKSTSNITTDASPTVQGLQLSLQSSRDEIKLLIETNQRLETELDALKTRQQTSAAEHERVLEKFGKLRSALMEERSKVREAEERACLAETLAGKGSFNSETTRVVSLYNCLLLRS